MSCPLKLTELLRLCVSYMKLMVTVNVDACHKLMVTVSVDVYVIQM